MEVKGQILVTDDDSGVCESFRMMLKGSYDVSVAGCGKECLTAIKQKRPDLVILDVRLPDMNGLDVFKEIIKIDETIPVIVITGVGTHKIALEALKLGAVDFIAKPVNFHYIKTAITNIFTVKDKGGKGLPSTEDLIAKDYLPILKMLNRIIEAKDPSTREHSKRVGKYAVKIAQELGLSEDEQEIMGQTAFLHDIGKIGVAEAILNKQEKLSPQEWVEVQRHALIGAEILEPLKLLHIEQSMIRHHHERYDGKGYPDHLKGEDIPLYARMLAVADAYDSMVHGRKYRYAYSPIEALTELERCSGSQFDPKIVKALARTLRKDKDLIKKGGKSNVQAKEV